MPRKIAAYLRQNLLALLALFVALGGTSYATLQISGSQIRNRSIDAVKLDPKSISASVKAWVDVAAGVTGAGRNVARVVASSSRVRVQPVSNGELITWPHRRFNRRCVVSATAQPEAGPMGGPFGVVTAVFNPGVGQLTLYGGDLARTHPQSAFVMVVCP